MRSYRLFVTSVFSGISLFIGGCSIYPLPEQSTGIDTYHIVEHIRCEMRDAIRDFVKRSLTRHGFESASSQLDSGELAYNQIEKLPLNSEMHKIISLYKQSEIGYEFTFDITEQNTATPSISFVLPFKNGSGALGLSATGDLQRRNLRNFRIYDNFGELVENFPDYLCSPAQSENVLYPISGKIGLHSIVETFLDLNQSGNLSGSKDKPDIPAIADTLTFTTKFSGEVNPTLLIIPMSHSLGLGSAGLKLDASRQDLHQVLVVLTLPPGNAKHKQLIAEARFAAASKELDRQRYIYNGQALGNLGIGLLQLVQ